MFSVAVCTQFVFPSQAQAAMDEWTLQQELFILPNIDCKIVILYKL
jgi:hypothetical protein